VFTTLEELFKLIVIFKIMINKILKDLINTGEVTSFIKNILVRIEEKKEYNKIIEKVVRKLIENNLYIKYK